LALQDRDKDHLEKYRRFLGVENAITSYQPVAGQKVVRVGVRSRHIVDRLKELGMDKKKPPLLAAAVAAGSRDFWRGVFDGDGSVLVLGSGDIRLALKGNRELVEQFHAYCSGLISTKAKVVRHSTISRVSYSGESAKVLMVHFYRDAVVSLNRKQRTVDAIIGAVNGEDTNSLRKRLPD
jgi:hypothetical protein